MRVMFFGSKITAQKLSESLKEREFEWISPTEVPEVVAFLEQERIDLAIVDSLVEKAKTACDYINDSCAIPLILMIREKQANWEELESFDVDSYLPDGVRGEELAVRLQAVTRRLSSPRYWQ